MRPSSSAPTIATAITPRLTDEAFARIRPTCSLVTLIAGVTISSPICLHRRRYSIRVRRRRLRYSARLSCREI